MIDFSKLSKTSPEANVEYAFHIAEKELNVPRLLDVEGEDLSYCTQYSIVTYCRRLYFNEEQRLQLRLILANNNNQYKNKNNNKKR